MNLQPYLQSVIDAYHPNAKQQETIQSLLSDAQPSTIYFQIFDTSAIRKGYRRDVGMIPVKFAAFIKTLARLDYKAHKVRLTMITSSNVERFVIHDVHTLDACIRKMTEQLIASKDAIQTLDPLLERNVMPRFEFVAVPASSPIDYYIELVDHFPTFLEFMATDLSSAYKSYMDYRGEYSKTMREDVRRVVSASYYKGFYDRSSNHLTLKPYETLIATFSTFIQKVGKASSPNDLHYQFTERLGTTTRDYLFDIEHDDNMRAFAQYFRYVQTVPFENGHDIHHDTTFQLHVEPKGTRGTTS